jgi:hypothetical protein
MICSCPQAKPESCTLLHFYGRIARYAEAIQTAVMPVLFYLSIGLQIACAVHVVRTQRPLYWIWLLIIGSYLAVLVYVLVAVIPDLRHDPRGRKALNKVTGALDPARQRRRVEQRLQLADTVDNRRHLAGECLRSGDYAQAAQLYASCLKGMYVDDPDLMLGLAQAQAGSEDFSAARQTLEALKQANPAYRSSDGHLLYARALDALGEHALALEEYEALATSYPGEEARYRYGMLLNSQHRQADARTVFQGMIDRAKLAPKYYRRKEQPWLDAAKKQLNALAGHATAAE